MKIGFMGLGQMGKGMALNLSKCGCEYVVNDISDAMFPDFEARGIHATTQVKELWDADIIFLCLPGTKIVEQVVLGEDGLAVHMQPGQLLVDCSTIAYLPTLKMAEELKAKGIGFVDAPVSGRQSKAEDGTLTIMCGGTKENFEKVKPYLDMMGSDIYYMGPSGSGQMTKMINNCIYDINVVAFCEMMTVAVKLGLEPEQIGKVINTGTAQSGASKFFIPQILEGNFDYGFTINDAYKDIVSCVEITSLKGLPVPVLDAMNSIYKMSMLKWYGDKYKGALVRVYEDLMGVKCRKPGFENT